MTGRGRDNLSDGGSERDHVERGLAELTRWEGAAPEVWKKALEAEDSGEHGEERWRWLFSMHVPRAPLAAAAMVLIVVTVGVVLLPQMGKTRSSGRGFSSAPAPSAVPVAPAEVQEFARGNRLESGAGFAESDGFAAAEEAAPMQQLASGPDDLQAPASPGIHARASREAPGRVQNQKAADEARHIVRRVSMEIHAEDVRAVFAKAQMIPSAAHGEFVQGSSIAGEGDEARGELTLRIAVDRLDSALNELRTLGEVHSEQATGEDVTTRVVDLEATLRNERRIESELLELLEKRADAELDDVMTLRESLDEVRQRIERLTGQREQLGRLVSLATVLVIIRAPDGDEDPAPAGAVIDYFKDVVAGAWEKGITLLADSVGFIVMVAVGGLVWWVVLGAAVLMALHARRRAVERAVERGVLR